MGRPKHQNPALVLLLAGALLLRAATPAGYMPASVGSGFLFELCPEGVPARFMQFVSAESGHEHHGGDHHGDDHQCPVGHMLLSAAAVDDAWQADLAVAVPAFAAPLFTSFTSVPGTWYRSRAPPA